jgi:aromatic-L-amino-acid decarboxylase
MMDPAALGLAMDTDAKAGRRPFFVCATIGTTTSAAVDPVRAIGAHAARHGAWLHVDAAYAGSACVCEEFRGSHDGVDLADSYTFNPHKWLLTNFDCNVFYVRDRRALTDTFAINPEYLRNAASDAGGVIDYRDWHIPLGRRFRALKLWFVLRSYGADGLRRHIRRHVELAKRFADLVSASNNFELAAPQRFGLVCFRHRGGDEKNRAILRAVNEGGSAYLTHAVIDGKVTLRLAIGAVGTEWRHVAGVWEAMEENDE